MLDALGIESAWDGIEGIVLDAVGTLIEPCPPVAEVYSEAARRQGTLIDPATLRSRFHQVLHDDEINELRGPLVTDEVAEIQRWRRIVANAMPGLPDPERAFQELWTHFASGAAWRCYADVAPALAVIRQAGLRIAIASNFDGRLRPVVAGLPELAGLGGTLAISSEVGFRKPHPSFYWAVCERLGLSAERMLAVGDDLEADFHGARRAGLRAVLLDRRGRHKEEPLRVTDLVALCTVRRG